MESILGAPEAFDGGHSAAMNGAKQGEARVDGSVLDFLGNGIVSGEQNEASTTSSFSTTELGACKASMETEVGKEGNGGIDRRQEDSRAIKGEEQGQRRR